MLSLPFITTLPQGVAELKRDMSERAVLTEMPEIHQFLDGFYLSRIGIRILIGAQQNTARSSRACFSHPQEATGLPFVLVCLVPCPLGTVVLLSALPSLPVFCLVADVGMKWRCCQPKLRSLRWMVSIPWMMHVCMPT